MLTNDVMHFAMDEKWAFFQFFYNKNTIEMKDDTFVVLFYVYIIAHFFSAHKDSAEVGLAQCGNFMIFLSLRFYVKSI